MSCRDLQRQEHSQVPELELSAAGTFAIFMDVFLPRETLMMPRANLPAQKGKKIPKEPILSICDIRGFL